MEKSDIEIGRMKETVKLKNILVEKLQSGTDHRESIKIKKKEPSGTNSLSNDQDTEHSQKLKRRKINLDTNAPHCTVINTNASKPDEKQSSDETKSTKWHRRCQMLGCMMNEAQKKLKRAPEIPKAIGDNASEVVQISYHKRLAKRAEVTDRLGLRRNCTTKDVRYCYDHQVEDKTVRLRMTIKDADGNKKTHSETVVMKNIPKPIGKNSVFAESLVSPSKGVGLSDLVKQVVIINH